MGQVLGILDLALLVYGERIKHGVNEAKAVAELAELRHKAWQYDILMARPDTVVDPRCPCEQYRESQCVCN